MSFILEYDRWGGLVLIDESGTSFEDVHPVRAFPLSAPSRSISICDAAGRELVYVESLDELTIPIRSVLETELAQQELEPVILKVLNEPVDREPATWHVKTDRGNVKFEVENDECVHRRDPYGLSILDSHGIRYEVPDVRNLDAHSRRVLERFL